MCAPQICMYAWLAWLVYDLHTTRMPGFLFVCPCTVLCYMCTGQGCMYICLARRVYALHTTRTPRFVLVCPFTVLSCMCDAHGYMYTCPGCVVYVSSAPQSSRLVSYHVGLHVRHTGTHVHLLGWCNARLDFLSNAVLNHMRAAQGCMCTRLAWFVCTLHTAHASPFSFTVISYMSAAHGPHV